MTRAVLVTGASGFLGGHLVRRLLAEGRPVVAASRQTEHGAVAGVRRFQIQDIDGGTDWMAALEHADTVVHCAGHLPGSVPPSQQSAANFHVVNVEGSARLARQAIASGARRFVFVSSIAVNGTETPPGTVYMSTDVPALEDDYGRSKLSAEIAVQSAAVGSGMEVVVLRPPVLYGPGSRGNINTLMRVVARGFPLPFGRVQDNRRSVLSVQNLVDCIVRCLDHEGAAGRTFLVSDGEDVSTADLLRRVGVAVGRPVRLLNVPVSLMRGVGVVTGRRDFARRLLGSLAVDCDEVRSALGWRPPTTLDESLRVAASSWTK